MNWTTYVYRFFRGLASGALRFFLFEFVTVWLFAVSIRRWGNLALPERQVIIWGIGLWGGALLAKATFNHASAEVNQFFYLVANPLASIGMLFLGLVLYKLCQVPMLSARRWIFLTAYLVLAIPFFHTLLSFQQRDSVVSTSFLKTLSKSLEGKNRLGVFLPNPQYLDTYRADPRMCTFCNFLKLTGKRYWVNSISTPVDTLGLPFPDRTNAIMMSPFYRYANKESNRNSSLEVLQLSFIYDNQVDFVVVERGVNLPEILDVCVLKTVKDSISGHIVYILDKPCGYY